MLFEANALLLLMHNQSPGGSCSESAGRTACAVAVGSHLSCCSHPSAASSGKPLGQVLMLLPQPVATPLPAPVLTTPDSPSVLAICAEGSETFPAADWTARSLPNIAHHLAWDTEGLPRMY